MDPRLTLAMFFHGATAAAEPEHQVTDPPPEVDDAAPDERARTACQTLREVADDENARAGCIEESFSVERQSLGGDLLQTLGQVVVDKAVESGWRLLEQQLRKLAACDNKDAKLRMTQTCALLDSATLQDLIAEPRSLMTAVVADLFDDLEKDLRFDAGLDNAAKPLTDGFVDAIGTWARGGESSFVRALRRSMKGQLVAIGKNPDCDQAWSDTKKMLWIGGQCIIDASTGSSTGFADCDLEMHLRACYGSGADGGDAVAKARVALISASDGFDTNTEAPPTDRAAALVEFYFDVVESALQGGERAKQLAIVKAFRVLVVGLVRGDWTQAMIGAGQVIDALDLPDCTTENDCKDKRKRFYALLAGVGQYAASYANSDPEQANIARRAAVESLITRMVRRSGRKNGAVFSIGGSFGLSGGYRAAFTGGSGTFAGPFQLALGASIDTYHPKKVGFHAEVTGIDLGQYVVFSKAGFSVDEPDVRAAIAPGVKAGVWFASRETPVFIAPFFTVSPFVRTDAGDSTWQAGGMVGVYIPFVDFN